MEFPVSDTNPTKVYGLPKNIATEVRAHHTVNAPHGLHTPTVPPVVETLFGDSWRDPEGPGKT